MIHVAGESVQNGIRVSARGGGGRHRGSVGDVLVILAQAEAEAGGKVALVDPIRTVMLVVVMVAQYKSVQIPEKTK